MHETTATTLKVIADHLAKQRERSVNAKDICQYRGPNGTMCAVGVLIPDELYSTKLEQTTIMSLLMAAEIPDHHRAATNIPVRDLLASLLPDVDAAQLQTLLRKIQVFHDGYGLTNGEFTKYLKYETLIAAFAEKSDEELSARIYQHFGDLYAEVVEK